MADEKLKYAKVREALAQEARGTSMCVHRRQPGCEASRCNGVSAPSLSKRVGTMPEAKQSIRPEELARQMSMLARNRAESFRWLGDRSPSGRTLSREECYVLAREAESFASAFVRLREGSNQEGRDDG